MKHLFYFMFFLLSYKSSAQVLPALQAYNTKMYSRWTYGGGASVNFAGGSSSTTTISLSPRVGYKITDNLEAGFSASYSWANNTSYRISMLGVGPFISYYIGRSFYLSGNFEEHFYSSKSKNGGAKINSNEASLYIGGGYLQPLGGNAYFKIGAAYNFLYNKNTSIFSSGFVPSASIVFGL